MMSLFKRKKTKKDIVKNHVSRRFNAAFGGRVHSYVPSYQRINADLKTDSIGMILKARDLAKNNDFVSGYLNTIVRNVIGSRGFRLQCNALNDDGSADQIANSLLEGLWNEYEKPSNSFVTTDERTGGRDFDILVLRTLVIDGEVFIRKVYDSNSKFGTRYELIDTLDIDFLYNVNECGDGTRIVCGIKIDRKGKPISYFIRTSNTDYYQTGERVEVKADEIIHIYRKFFAGQVRGYTPLSATILNLNQLESYKEAEIIAARMQACNMAFYTKTSSSSGGDGFGDDENIDVNGDWVSEMSPAQIAFAPDGYDVKQLNNNHPNSNFGQFVKSVLRGISNSLGTSYNKSTSDYESVNYSSLREAALEDRASWQELQQFIIENWKDVQFAEFLKNVLLNDLTSLPFSKFKKFSAHKFFGRAWDWVAPQQDLNAIKLKLALKLTDPITEIEKLGRTADDVLNRWELWNKKLEERGLSQSEIDVTKLIEDDLNEDLKENIDDNNI